MAEIDQGKVLLTVGALFIGFISGYFTGDFMGSKVDPLDASSIINKFSPGQDIGGLSFSMAERTASRCVRLFFRAENEGVYPLSICPKGLSTKEIETLSNFERYPLKNEGGLYFYEFGNLTSFSNDRDTQQKVLSDMIAFIES